MPSEMTIRGSIVVKKPVVEAFEAVRDLDSVHRWLPFCESCRPVSPGLHSPDGALGRGMRVHITFRAPGNSRLYLGQEITAVESGRHITSTTFRPEIKPTTLVERIGYGLTPRANLRIEFEPLETGTLVSVDVAMHVLAPGLVDVMRPFMLETLHLTLQSLKRVVEQSDAYRQLPWIFFNYRRNDTPFGADRVYDEIVRAFGRGAVFRDSADLRGGGDFDRQLVDAINRSRVFLVVIGPRWVEELDKRQNSPEEDYVLKEILTARSLPDGGPLVIPILIGDTPIPHKDQLTEALRFILTTQMVRIRREPDFRADRDRLLAELWRNQQDALANEVHSFNRTVSPE